MTRSILFSVIEYKYVYTLYVIKHSAAFLVAHEIWPVAIAIGVGIIYPAWLPYAVLIALLFWPLRWLVKGRPSVRTPIDIPVLVLMLMVPVTLWATALPQRTLPQVTRLVAGIFLFYALINWTDTRGRLRTMLDAFVLLTILLALIAPFGVEWLTTKYPLLPIGLFERLPLLLSDPANPNVMAGFLIILLPIAYAFLLFTWRDLSVIEKLLSLLAVLTATVMLVMTQSRGAWLAFLLATGVLVALRWRKAWILYLIGILIATLASLYFGAGMLLKGFAGEGQLLSLEGRLEVWSRALYMIQDFSLTGAGMGLFMDVTDLLYPFFLFRPGTIEHAHNLYLQVAVDLGLPGLVAWLAVLGGMTYTAWRLYLAGRRNDDRLVSGLGAGLFCSQIALIIHGLTDAVTWGMVRPAPLVWAIWGAVGAGSLLFLVPVNRPQQTGEPLENT